VDNCAESIVLAGLRPGIDGEIFNVVDDEVLTSRQFLRAYRQKVKPFFSVRVPYHFAYAMCLLWEKYSKWSKDQLPPVFNRRRCAAQWKGNHFSNQKLHQRLGWKQRVNMEDAMAFWRNLNLTADDPPSPRRRRGRRRSEDGYTRIRLPGVPFRYSPVTMLTIAIVRRG